MTDRLIPAARTEEVGKDKGGKPKINGNIAMAILKVMKTSKFQAKASKDMALTRGPVIAKAQFLP